MGNKTTRKHKRARNKERQTDNGIGCGAHGLGDALKANTTLKVLKLSREKQDHKKSSQAHNAAVVLRSDNRIGSTGAYELASGLRENRSLTELDVSSEQHKNNTKG